ncbi:MAG: hypothetical protein CPSOU_2690 [uncultured Paraburkholderia sp.]|nr:MAG: hypothetical protein CPSOU_2690 [uncultured Paraburkholderia sp.]
MTGTLVPASICLRAGSFVYPFFAACALRAPRHTCDKLIRSIHASLPPTQRRRQPGRPAPGCRR